MSTLKAVLFAVGLAGGALLSGQSITGDLLVNVSDPSGAVVSRAKVSLVEVDTNVSHEGLTDSLGNFLFAQLKPGHYRLEVTATGFLKANITDIVITVGQRARVDVRLTVGTLSETINVSAAAETLLNAESASVGQVINEAPIVELPLNGRNFGWIPPARSRSRTASRIRSTDSSCSPITAAGRATTP